MRLRAILFAAVALGGVAVAAHRVAEAATAYLERATVEQATEALAAAGQDWMEVEADGLIVSLAGSAPDETSRFRAVEIVRQIAAPRRVEDRTGVRAADALSPPDFALELLRNEDEVSLIGLVPGDAARDTIIAALRSGGLGGQVTDMLEAAELPAPAGWGVSLGFGLSVLVELPRAKVSVAPGRVAVTAVTDTAEARTALEARLAAAAPDDVALALDISSPRPVIAPFVVDFSLEDGIGAFSACSAEDDAALQEILVAARATGYAGGPDCAIGLGAPSPEWERAVAAGLAALLALDGGRFVIADLEAVLTGPEGVTPERLTEIGGALEARLPDVFSLTTIAPPQMETQPGGGEVYAPRFEAELGEDGTIRLRGAVGDEVSREAIGSYASALFGHDRVTDVTVLDPQLPDGWPGRVLAGIEALAEIKEGTLQVSRDAVAIDGWDIEADADARVEALLAAKVGAGAAVEVRFDPEAAARAAAAEAAVAEAARPRPDVCAEEVAAILADGSIEFGAGSSDIDPASSGVIAAIADVLRGCPGARFEIGGHTDSQGAAEVNQRLSEQRAEAVLVALRAENLPRIRLEARGHGADQPIADNDTEEGRARNRRIALTLIPDAPEPSYAEPYVGPR